MNDEERKYECPICNQKKLEDDDYVEHIVEKHHRFFCYLPQLFDGIPMHIHRRICARSGNLIFGDIE